jgi:flagellar FliJ protein
MATLNAIKTLSDLSTRQSEDAAKRLGQANHARDKNEQQFNLLVEYRESYANQLQLQLSQGLTVTDYSNFQQFMTALDQAIAQQNRIVQTSLQFVEKERSHWQLCERKRLSFDTLTQRAQQDLIDKEKSQDQKQTDERASRRYSSQK